MTRQRAAVAGWGALFLSAAVAAAMPLSGQAGYAATVIAVLGLPHGAADLALVPRRRHASFLMAYLATVAAVVLLWGMQPTAALVLFLGTSFVHFATDDHDGPVAICDWAKAASLIAGPAALHCAAIAELFRATGASGAAAATLAELLALLGAVAVPTALALVLLQRNCGDRRLVDAVALAALVLAPPLVGFVLGFIVLHAREQTVRRQRKIGLPDISAYLRHVAPVLAGALVVLAGLAALMPSSPTGIKSLFVSIAALAMPHMIVTPAWRIATAPIRWRHQEAIASSPEPFA